MTEAKKKVFQMCLVMFGLLYGYEALACAPYGGDCWTNSDCCSGWCNWTWTDFYCDCSDDYPNLCGDDCWQNCSGGGSFSCKNGEPYCKCPSQYPNQCNEYCYNACPAGSDFECDGDDGFCVSNYYDECEDLECSSGDVYCYDSNGDKQDKYDDCDTSYDGSSYWTCKNGNAVLIQDYYDAGCSAGECYASWESEDVEVKVCSNGCDNDVCKASYDACKTKQCSSGDVYCYDSNGDKQDKYDDCDTSYDGSSYWMCDGNNAVLIKNYYDAGCSGSSCYSTLESEKADTEVCQYGCVDGKCKSAPINNCATKKCFDNDLYCYDSLGQKQGKETECGNTTYYNSAAYCQSGNLFADDIKKEKGCSNNVCYTKEIIVGVITVEACSCGCANNDCVSPCTPVCNNECALGAVGCNSAKTQKWSCAKLGDCYKKQYIACAASESCSSGSCIKNCAPAQDHKACVGDKLVWQDACNQTTQTMQDCVQMPDICNDAAEGIWSDGFCSTQDLKCYYAKNTVCQYGCTNGECQTPICTDKCVVGVAECVGAGYHQCEKKSNGCYDWSVVKSCPTDNVCLAGKCLYQQPECALMDIYWDKAEVSDTEEVTLFIKTNGVCQGEAIEIQIWDKDWWIFDDQIDFGYQLTINDAVEEFIWGAIYETDFANLLEDWCEGPYCFNMPEYYAKIIFGDGTIVVGGQAPYLQVHPYYLNMSYTEYLEEVAKAIAENEKQEYEIAYLKCIDSQTISDFCAEVFANADITPLTEEVMALDDWLIEWFDDAVDYLDSGHLLILAAACGSCNFQTQIGQLTFQPTKVLETFGGSIADYNFIYPYSIYGDKACGVCLEELLPAIDIALTIGDFKDAGLLAATMSKMMYFAAFSTLGKKTVKELLMDKAGLGAKLVVKSGDDEIEHRITPFVDNVGNKVIRQQVLDNPIWSFPGGKEFMKFNALKGGGPIIGVQALSVEGREFFASAFTLQHFQDAYQNLKKLAKANVKDKFAITKIKPVEVTKINKNGVEVPYAVYLPGYNKIELGVKIPFGFYGDDISQLDTMLVAFEHEGGHLLQAQGLIQKGFPLVELSKGKKNPVVEYFNDRFMMAHSTNGEIYKGVLKGKLVWVQQTPIKTWVSDYKVALESDDLYQFELMHVYNIADELGDETTKQFVKNGFLDYYPDGWNKFESGANKLRQAAETFGNEITVAGAPSGAFKKVVDDYKVNWWETSDNYKRNFEGEEVDIALIDNGVFGVTEEEEAETLHLACYNNAVWWLDSTGTPVSEVNVCAENEICTNVECIDVAALAPTDDDSLFIQDGCMVEAAWLVLNMEIQSCETYFDDGTPWQKCDINDLGDGMLMVSAKHDYSEDYQYLVQMRITDVIGIIHEKKQVVNVSGCSSADNAEKSNGPVILSANVVTDDGWIRYDYDFQSSGTDLKVAVEQFGTSVELECSYAMAVEEQNIYSMICGMYVPCNHSGWITKSITITDSNGSLTETVEYQISESRSWCDDNGCQMVMVDRSWGSRILEIFLVIIFIASFLAVIVQDEVEEHDKENKER